MNYHITTPNEEHAEGIAHILGPYANEKVILPRDAEEIASVISQFRVATDDEGKLLGVVAYHDYGAHLKEIRSLAVLRSHQGFGIGRKLVEEIIRFFGSTDGETPTLMTLTYSPEFFRKLGFTDIEKEKLPEKIWKDCQYCSNRDDCRETALTYTY